MIKTLDIMKNAASGETDIMSGTSDWIQVGERRNLSIQVSSTPGATITVDVSNDMIVITPYNRINTNVTNTNAQTDTRVASVVVGAAGNAILFFPRDHFNYIRINATAAVKAVLSAY